MAKDQGVKAPPARSGAKPATRPLSVTKPAAASSVAAVPAAPKKKTSPAQFAREVRLEARKITWPAWKETWITSVMVGIMVVSTALFFLVTDSVLSFLIQQILKFAA